MNVTRTISSIGIVLSFVVLQGSAAAQNWKLMFDLRGQWKFEIGDDKQRAEPGFDDSHWESIDAPAPWEDEGFPGYDGYAWYRKHFRSSSDWNEKSLAFHLGNIDDVDEVYLNGHLVGSTGSFPPHYSTAYDIDRIYPFPAEYLDPSGDNVVAVRVFDQELSGGILRGKLGVYEDLYALRVDLHLPGVWKFATGDDPAWKDIQCDDSRWKQIHVPAYWETQGYPEYDGFAWYRVLCRIPKDLADQHLVLLLGKIDDFDETYLNGIKVGATGAMERREQEIPGSDAYRQLRAYTLPPGCLRADGENVIAVRVYDGYKDGGIYSGPIGFVTRENFLRWQHQQKRSGRFLDWFFNMFGL
jgi:hypothetical protein